MISLTVIVTCCVLAVLYQRAQLYLKHRKFKHRYSCLPATKYSQYERFLGIDLMLENFKSWKAGQLLDRMQSRFQRAGNTYSAVVAGNQTIFTIEPENIRAIFAEKFDDFDSGWIRRRAFAPSIGDVLFTADGARWHQQRAMLRPAFKKQQFAAFAFYEQDIEILIQRIPIDGSTVDLAPLFHTHALTLASRLLFDEPMATLHPDFASSSTRFIDALYRVNKGSERRFRLGRFLPLMPRDESYEAGCKVVHEYGDVFVEKALVYRESWRSNRPDQNETPKDRYVFLQELAKEIDDPRELRNQLLGMLLGGGETTGSLLTGCVSLLSTRPHLWNKLHKEAVNMGRPSSEAIKSFTSLTHVINEVLRLYPVLPYFGRMANKDTFLPVGGGANQNSRVFVPKGTLALINTHSLHRRTDIFGDDADDFKPERWASKKALGHWSYLPFGGGPRICIGREYRPVQLLAQLFTNGPEQFALMEVSYTLARLLQTFPVISSRDERPWLESIGISLSNGNGAKVGFRLT